jgi:hypothetical protein
MANQEGLKLYKKAEKMIDDIEDMIDDLPEIKDKSDKSKAVVKRIAKSVLGLSAAITVVGVGASAITTDNKVLGVTLGGIGGMIGSAVALSLNKTFKDKMRSALNKYQMSMLAAINRINDIEDEKKEDEIRANTKNININRTNTNTNDTTIRYESVSVTSTKLAIYEACNNGFITETEKSELIDIIDKSAEDELKKKRNIKKAIKITLIITGLAAATLVSLKTKKKYDAKKCDKLKAELKECESQLKAMSSKIDDSPLNHKDIVDAMMKCVDISRKISHLSGADASALFNRQMAEYDKVMNLAGF